MNTRLFRIFFSADSKSSLKLQNNHYLVMAMGTGLGTGLLFSSTYKFYKFDNAPKFEVIPLEAGHCSITYPAQGHANFEKENKRLATLSKSVYNAASVPEFEDICSGRGLRACYLYETGVDLDAAEGTLKTSRFFNTRINFHFFKQKFISFQESCRRRTSCSKGNARSLRILDDCSTKCLCHDSKLQGYLLCR